MSLNLDLSAFELPQRMSSLSEVRALFWPTDETYCVCDVAELHQDPGKHYDDAIISYHDLVRRLIGGDVDDRCATMEVAVEAPETAPFPLNLQGIKGLVVPQRYLDHPEVEAFMRDYPTAKICHYKTYAYMRPTQRHSEIVRLVGEVMAA